jgi:hypothetical protein
MPSVIEWAYPRRDPIAWGTALALAALALAASLRARPPVKGDREIEAFLEKLVEPPAPTPAPPVPVAAPNRRRRFRRRPWPVPFPSRRQ